MGPLYEGGRSSLKKREIARKRGRLHENVDNYIATVDAGI